MYPYDQNNQGAYDQYTQAANTGNYDNIDRGQAMGYMQQFMQNAPSDMQQQVYQNHFDQMPYEQRNAFAQQMPPEYGVDPNNSNSMAQGFTRLGQERPNFAEKIMDHPLLDGVGVALAAEIGKHVMEHREERRDQY